MTPSALRRLRHKLGLTQAGLAKELGVHTMTLSKWERGAEKIPTTAAKLVEMLSFVHPAGRDDAGECREVTVPFLPFVNALKRAARFVRTEERVDRATPPRGDQLALLAVHVVIDGTAGHVESSDRYRVFREAFPLGASAPAIDILVPTPLIKAVGTIAASPRDSATLLVWPRYLGVRASGLYVAAGLVQASYPNVEQMVKRALANPHNATVHVGPLRDVLRRLAVVVEGDPLHRVQIELQSGRITILARNPVHGEQSESIAGQYTDKAVTLDFNAEFLLDYLSTLSEAERLTILFPPEAATDDEGKRQPFVALICGPSTYVVVPLRAR